MLPTVPDLAGKTKKQAWKEVALHPPLSAGPADPAGAAQEEHLLLLRIANAPGQMQEHIYVFLCVCVYVVSEFAPTRRLRPTSPSLAGWPGGCGERRTRHAVSIIPLSSRCSSCAANALYASRRQLRAWAAEGRSAGLGVCFLSLSPPTSGQARRGRRRGAQLDREFALHASRRRIRAWLGGGGGGALSWTGSLLSTPLAADFGPGPEAAAGRGVCFLRLPPSTSGLARRGRRRGAQLEIFLSTPRAADSGPGPGVGGGGARSWTGSLPSTPLAADFGPRPEGAVEGRAAWARSLLFYLSLTGLSMRGPAMLGHWSQHHLRL